MTFSHFYQTALGDLLTTQARAHGRRPFLRLGDQTWTYAQAEQTATALAGALASLGLRSGDRLAILLPNLPEYVITLFAAAKADLLVVPINVRRHPDEVRARLERTRPKAVVTFSQPQDYWGLDHLGMLRAMQPDLPFLNHLIAVGGGEGALDWAALCAQDGPVPRTSVHPQDAAAIVHTLGRAGMPRGAVLTHGGLVRNAADMAANLACTEADVFLAAVPFSNTFGLTATILVCTVAGAQLVCLPRYQPGEALRLIREMGVTVHHGVPTMFAMELNHPDFRPQDCATLRTGIMSGAPCPPDLVRRVREQMGMELVVAYGLTEASPAVSMTRLDDGPITATETVGRPMPGVEVRVVDERGQTLPPGQEGELWVRGYNVMRGYWQDDRATAEVLDADGWLRTGDLAVIEPDGPIRILGRKDDVIIRGGVKVHPAPVEMVLRAFPGVKDAVLVGVPDTIYGQLPVACVVAMPEAEVSEEALLSYAAEHLSEDALPVRVVFFDVLPRLPSGQVDRAYLADRVRLRGRAWKFGANIDTDAIIPARHCNTADPRELALHCMEDADPDFVRKMRRGDLIVADENFGCGSSREVAPITIKAAGVSAVIAKSFARIFFRNAINIGLPILECPEAVDGIQEGDEIEVEPATGTIRNLTRGETYQAAPFPDFLRQIIDRGGLLAYVQDRLAGKV